MHKVCLHSGENVCIYGVPRSMLDHMPNALSCQVMEIDLLSLDSVVKFAEAWNAQLGPLHVLINNAGIFSIGGGHEPNSCILFSFPLL